MMRHGCVHFWQYGIKEGWGRLTRWIRLKWIRACRWYAGWIYFKFQLNLYLIIEPNLLSSNRFVPDCIAVYAINPWPQTDDNRKFINWRILFVSNPTKRIDIDICYRKHGGVRLKIYLKLFVWYRGIRETAKLRILVTTLTVLPRLLNQWIAKIDP